MRFSVNDNGKNILHIAVVRGSPEDLKQLLDVGLDVNQKDKFGNTPLHYALNRRNRAIILELLKYRSEFQYKGVQKNSDIILHNLGLTKIMGFFRKVIGVLLVLT